jgi:cell division protein FtsB
MSKEARGIFNILFVGAAVGTGLYLSRGPWEAYRRQRVSADQAQAKMRAAEKERTDLTRQNAFTDSPAGRDEVARNHGYLKPGEVKIEVAP